MLGGLGRAGQHRGPREGAWDCCCSLRLPVSVISAAAGPPPLPVSGLPSLLPVSLPSPPSFSLPSVSGLLWPGSPPSSPHSFLYSYSHPLPLLRKLCLPRGPAPGVPCPLCAPSCCVLGALSPLTVGGRLCPCPSLCCCFRELWVGLGSCGGHTRPTSDPVALSPQKVEEVGAWALGGGRASPPPSLPAPPPPHGYLLPFTLVRGGGVGSSPSRLS